MTTTWNDRDDYEQSLADHYALLDNPPEPITCRHCGRPIEYSPSDGWYDPNATGDDRIWRETCDQHDTFTAEHEPDEPDEGWTDEQIAHDHAHAAALRDGPPAPPQPGTPFTRTEQTWSTT